jgi:hypothetical protein
MPTTATEQVSDPPIVQTAETFPFDTVPLQSSRLNVNSRRRSSMQDAADTIMWKTFDYPGVASQAMLPPQPSRAYSHGQRTSSIGQPLQLMDSNQTVPYTGKGKGRARDFDPNQQQASTGWDQTTVANFGQPSVPYVEDVQPFAQQPPNVDPGTFTFLQEQFNTWQPVHPDYSQLYPQQQANINPLAVDFQPAQLPQAHPHAHPYPVVQARPFSQMQPQQLLYRPPAPLLQQQPLQMTLPQRRRSIPGFSPPQQQPQSPGSMFLDPWIEPQPQRQQRQAQPQDYTDARPTHPQPQQHGQGHPQVSTDTQPASPQQTSVMPVRVGVGYRYRPGLGFVCQTCGTVVHQPHMHLLVVDDRRARWCEAAGTEVSDVLESVRRKRSERYV